MRVELVVTGPDAEFKFRRKLERPAIKALLIHLFGLHPQLLKNIGEKESLKIEVRAEEDLYEVAIDGAKFIGRDSIEAILNRAVIAYINRDQEDLIALAIEKTGSFAYKYIDEEIYRKIEVLTRDVDKVLPHLKRLAEKSLIPTAMETRDKDFIVVYDPFKNQGNVLPRNIAERIYPQIDLYRERGYGRGI